MVAHHRIPTVALIRMDDTLDRDDDVNRWSSAIFGRARQEKANSLASVNLAVNKMSIYHLYQQTQGFRRGRFIHDTLHRAFVAGS